MLNYQQINKIVSENSKKVTKERNTKNLVKILEIYDQMVLSLFLFIDREENLQHEQHKFF